jgi:hypothetical protein
MAKQSKEPKGKTPTSTGSKKKTNYYEDMGGNIGKGAAGGSLLGAALGGVAGWKSAKQKEPKKGFFESKADYRKRKLKASLLGGTAGAATGGVLGGNVGGVAGDVKNVFGNIKNKAKSKRDDRRRRWARGSAVLTGSGLPGAFLSDLVY